VAARRDVSRSATDRIIDDRPTIAVDTQATVSTGRWAWEWTKSILVAFVLFLVIRTFLVEAFRIPTGSMENTLLVGDFLLVNKAIFGSHVPGTDVSLPAFAKPERGDIVVFVPPHDPGKNYVKRLIGASGDTVEMQHKILYINRKPISESYARYTDPNDVYSPGMFWQCDFAVAAGPCRPSRDNWGPIVVPADSYLMLGDNRDDSEDSRYWGFVDRSAIKGRPLFIYYSFDPGTLRPFSWLTAIRWSRIGDTVH
jgi:signal peptidase I